MPDPPAPAADIEPASPYPAVSDLPEHIDELRGVLDAATSLPDRPAPRSPLTRRHLLGTIAIGAVASIAGCVGDDDDDTGVDDDNGTQPTPDEGTPTPGDDTTPPDEETPPPDDNDQEQIDLDDDISSFIADIWMTEEAEDGEVTAEMELTYRWDFANERSHHSFRLISEGEEFEIYHIEETIYWVFDGMCQQVDDEPFEPDAHFRVDDPREFEDDDEFFHQGSGEYRGQTVEVWRVREEMWDDEFEEGWLEIYIDPGTNRLVGIEGEFIYTDHEGRRLTQRFEQHFREYNQDLGIEVPSVCVED